MKKHQKKLIEFSIPEDLPYVGMPAWRPVYTRPQRPLDPVILGDKLKGIRLWIRENSKSLGAKAVALRWKADYARKKLAAGDLAEADFFIGHLTDLINVQIPADRDRRMMSSRRGRRKGYLKSVLEEILQRDPKATYKRVINQLKSRVGCDGIKNKIQEITDNRVYWLDERGKQRETGFRTLQNQIAKIRSELKKPETPKIYIQKISPRDWIVYCDRLEVDNCMVRHVTEKKAIKKHERLHRRTRP